MLRAWLNRRETQVKSQCAWCLVLGAWCLVKKQVESQCAWCFVQLRTTNYELRTTNYEPRTKNQEPRTKNQEPRTKNQEPRTKNSGFAALPDLQVLKPKRRFPLHHPLVLCPTLRALRPSVNSRRRFPGECLERPDPARSAAHCPMHFACVANREPNLFLS